MVEVAEGLRTEVLFNEARRLRRRRWVIGAAVVAVALLAAGTALSSAGHLSSAASGPRHASRENTATLASAAHASLYFRPIECTIATPTPPGAGTPTGSPDTTAIVITYGANDKNDNGMPTLSTARKRHDRPVRVQVVELASA